MRTIAYRRDVIETARNLAAAMLIVWILAAVMWIALSYAGVSAWITAPANVFVGYRIRFAYVRWKECRNLLRRGFTYVILETGEMYEGAVMDHALLRDTSHE
jgi:hypothetical protein